MDERLKEALQTAKANMVYGAQINRIKTELETDLLIAFEGGRFKASVELISYVGSRVDLTSIVVQQINGLPQRITDIPRFYDQLEFAYDSAMNSAVDEIARIKRVRTVDGMTSV